MAEKQYIIQAENEIELEESYCFFDLETTGTNINTDRIVEICYLKVYPNGNEETKTMRINPEMHIPEQSSAIHGIYDADVADCPTFKEVAKEIARDIEGCDLAGFNSNRFDIPVLAEEFLRAGVDIDMMKRKFIDVQVIYHKLEQRTCLPPINLLRKESGRCPYSRSRHTCHIRSTEIPIGPLSGRIAKRYGISSRIFKFQQERRFRRTHCL